MKLLLMGRTGTGKDSVRKVLEERYGMAFVRSCTTRPKRSPGEDTHVFVTREEAGAETDKVARTVINGYEYYASRKQVEACDGYIIDPEGARLLMRNMPGERFVIAYIKSGDEGAREAMAARRSEDPGSELEVFASRCGSEDARFSAFESLIEGGSGGCAGVIGGNCAAVLICVNSYAEGDIGRMAGNIRNVLEAAAKAP